MKTRNTLIIACWISILLFVAAPFAFGQDEETAVPDEQADTQAEQGMMSDIRIEEAAICRSVEDLEPIGAGDVFSSDQGRLSCFSRVVGAQEDTEIVHNWYYGETLMAGINLHVGSSSWRTYSTKNILPEQTGEWKVEIMSQSGELLKRIYFVVQE